MDERRTLVTSRTASAAMAALAAPLAAGAIYLTPLIVGTRSLFVISVLVPTAALCVLAFVNPVARCFRPCQLHLDRSGLRCRFLLAERHWAWTDIAEVRLVRNGQGPRMPVLVLHERGYCGRKSVTLPWGWTGMSAAAVRNLIQNYLNEAQS